MTDKPRVFLLNPDCLTAAKEHAANGLYTSELQELYAKADGIIAESKIYTVTWSGYVPPSGDIHDFFSISPYWWPDPSKPDGLPYIRRDGETNPERDKISDRRPCERMISDVGVLARAYYFGGDEKYAAYAKKLLRTWFLNAETKMNPNINHGQMRRGRDQGNKGGIIATRRFCLLIDSVGLLDGSTSWTSQDQTALQGWMSDFIDWLIVHPFGCDERASSNNHGTAYDMQVMSLSLFVEGHNLAKLIVENYTRERMRTQIEPDGAQPEEIRRTKGLHYCVENITYFFRIARMATLLGIDLYEERSEGRGGLKDVIYWLLPFMGKENNWPYQQITEWHPKRFAETLHVAYAVYKDDKMKKALESLGWDTPTLEEFINIPSGLS